jgi:hypothetical protein
MSPLPLLLRRGLSTAAAPPQLLRLVTVDLTGAVLTPRMSVGAAYLQVIGNHQRRLDGAPPLPEEDAVSKAFHSAYRLQHLRHPCFGHGDDMSCCEWWEGVVKPTLANTGLLPYYFDSFDELFDGKFSGAEGDGEPFWGVAPGAAAALGELRQHHPGLVIGAVSNSDPRHSNLLANLGLGAHFDFVLTSAEAGVSKPDELFFEAALGGARRCTRQRSAPLPPHKH